MAKAILAVILGVILGMVVNGGLIQVGTTIIPAPEGVDPMDVESIRANIDRYEPKHWMIPLLAHALGTLVGASIAAFVAPFRKMGFALGMGIFFLAGGIAASMMIPAPTWFIAVDLVCCYIPMGWLGGRLFTPKEPSGDDPS